MQKFFPVGTYRRLMGDTMTKMMDGMMGSMMKMPLRQLMSLSGKDADELIGLDDTSIEEISAIVDPHFRERTKLGMDAMMGSMVDMMDEFEPNVRDALTRAYARKFDKAQLGEIDRFFATPTGGKFAHEYMAIFADPEIMKEMMGLMPQMLKKMPDMVSSAEKATAKIPKARRYAELSKAEREKLASLLGISVKDLENNSKNEKTDEGTGL